MTLKELFKKVAVALDEFDLVDYENKIYECADSVQREIATFVIPITRYATVSSIGRIIELPEDCYEVIALIKEGKKISFTNNGDGTINAEDGTYRLKYNAYPQKISSSSSLSQVLDISQEAVEAMVYGTCAGLCINDEPELYSAYMDRYNGILEAIMVRKNRFPYAEITGGISL